MKKKLRLVACSIWATMLVLFGLGVAQGEDLISSENNRDFAYGPPSSSVVINGISYAGSGCPSGSKSVAAKLGTGAKSLRLDFSSINFSAQAGGGKPISASRKRCTVNVNLSYPRGWSYALVDAQYKGGAYLSPRTLGRDQTAYSFVGSAPTAYFKTYLYGPLFGNYARSATLPSNKLVWSACSPGRALTVSTSRDVTNRQNRQGIALLTLQQGKPRLFSELYGIRWRPCGRQ